MSLLFCPPKKSTEVPVCMGLKVSNMILTTVFLKCHKRDEACLHVVDLHSGGLFWVRTEAPNLSPYTKKKVYKTLNLSVKQNR